MAAIMADNDIQGQFQAILQVFQSSYWRDYWERLACSVETFESLGIPRHAPDVDVWQACQRHRVVLITGNRNDDSPTSLESAILTFNSPSALPVFTIASPTYFKSREYVDRIAERILELLTDLEQLEGAGRIYVP